MHRFLPVHTIIFNILFFASFLAINADIAAQTQSPIWHFSVGLSLQNSILINTAQSSFSSQYKLPVKYSPGLLIKSGWQRNHLSLQFSGGIASNKVRFQHHFEYQAPNGTFESKVFFQENFLSAEVLGSAYYVHFVGRHRLYIGGGGGFAYQWKNATGEGHEERNSLTDPAYYGFAITGAAEQQTNIIPLVSLNIELNQYFKSGKLGIVYGIQNKWGLLPLIEKERSYTASFEYNSDIASYHTGWAGRITNISAYILLKVDFSKAL
ncbi:hypothetical protein BH09BAC1_BH09BAC1_00050 [soil metagenome]